MGMETLNNAARAAGYAMATADELLNNNKTGAKPENEAWRPGEAVVPGAAAPPATAMHSVTSWVKMRFFGALGRGAPA